MAAGHRGAFLAALSVAALGQIVAFLALLAGALPGASAGQAARYGWALFYAFHHVGVAFRSPDLHLPAGAEGVLAWPGGYAVDAVVAFALLSGTALAAWMLMRAGRSIGGAVGGPELRRGIHGAKVAVPYAILSWIPSWGLSVRLRLPDASPLSVHLSHLAAFFWPLALGAAFGALGGKYSAATRPFLLRGPDLGHDVGGSSGGIGTASPSAAPRNWSRAPARPPPTRRRPRATSSNVIFPFCSLPSDKRRHRKQAYPDPGLLR